MPWTGCDVAASRINCQSGLTFGQLAGIGGVYSVMSKTQPDGIRGALRATFAPFPIIPDRWGDLLDRLRGSAAGPRGEVTGVPRKARRAAEPARR
jgi:hypothetical protein